MVNIIKTRGRITPRPTLENRSFQLCRFHSTYTQSPNARISVPIAYLLHVNGAHTNGWDQNRYDPWYGSTDSGTVPSAPWYSVRQGTDSWVAICTKSSG
ncbi:hypothetical protein TNCV_2241601 [Trichonephila clavipes]|nr:hypothetical protein TNCV_2241601 [Trichonephila clavipes]